MVAAILAALSFANRRGKYFGPMIVPKRDVLEDFKSDAERIISAEEADRRSREKFPSRKKRLRAKEAKS